MKVRVLLFGVLKDLTGRSSEELTVPEHATVADVIEHYQERLAGLRGMARSIAISINQEYSAIDSPLHADDEIALLPPVSGGSGPALKSTAPYVRITHDRIDTSAILEQLKQPEDGAAVVFEGIVRNHSRGRRTLFLEYEAYEEMALKQLEDLARQACSKFEIRDAAIIHRLGHLEIGETSVLIVVASAHRAAAFEACRWLIDTLKKTVPIWKKEHFADGAVWADGEAFPEQFTTGTISKTPASK
jgi:molybdopterin synthase catalytic subunit/molybdopterin converting factor small subunit